jgi:hypothetical protein
MSRLDIIFFKMGLGPTLGTCLSKVVAEIEAGADPYTEDTPTDGSVQWSAFQFHVRNV